MKNLVGILDKIDNKTHSLIRCYENPLADGKGNVFYEFSEDLTLTDIQLYNHLSYDRIELIFEDKKYEDLKKGLEKAIELLKYTTEYDVLSQYKKEVLKLEHLLK